MTYTLTIVNETGARVETRFLPLEIACGMARRAVKNGCERAIVCDPNGRAVFHWFMPPA